VQQLFETAKNLSLYSWFVYPFHQSSELLAFAAVEMALRLRHLKENPIDPSKSRKPLALYGLMQHAKKHKWISNDRFTDTYERAVSDARICKKMRKIKIHDFDKCPLMPVDEPTGEEIMEALKNSDRVGDIVNNANKIRNSLAHGSNLLNPRSISTLHTSAEVINQIYSTGY
jgi:hypothetical protein